MHKLKLLFSIIMLISIAGCGRSAHVHNENPNAATPYFSPTVTEISKNATITIGSADEDAAIYYTTDGNDPDSSSTEYSDPFSLGSGTWTVKARAYVSGKNPSDIAVQTYTVIDGTVKPVVSAAPVAGRYAEAQSVTLSSSNSSSDLIYYTTDGSDPVIGSAATSLYSAAITVKVSTQIRAFAKTADNVVGDTAVFDYTIDEVIVPAPVITPTADEITENDEVSITASLGIITYTIDSEDFTTAQSYSGPFTLSSGTHIVRAIATNDGVSSVVAAKTYIVTEENADTTATPSINVLGTVPYRTATSIEITTATSGAIILYSLDNGEYQTYSGAFTLSAAYHRIKAKAQKSGLSTSAIAYAAFDIVPDSAAVRIYYKGSAAPKIWVWETTPTYNTSEQMGYAWSTRPSMTALSGVSGWYYFDIPTDYRQSGTLNVKFGEGSDLAVTAGKYWYASGTWYSANPDVLTIPVVSASPVAKTYSKAQTVTLSSSNADDSIYYTTNGNNPTTASTKYSGAISVSSSTVIKAMGVNADGNAGDIYSFAYVIDSSYDDVIPEITPSLEAGWYKDAQTVSFTIKDNTAAITRAFYTTDNTVPTESSTLYVSGDASQGKTGSSFSLDLPSKNNFKFLVVDGAGNKTYASYSYRIAPIDTTTDFRKETIYFVITTRFYDGDSSNNVYCWDSPAANKANNDPEWRGDFKGLIEKLDYIKAMGFSAIWITPVVENASGYDYHGYHAMNFKKVDKRYLSDDTSYQDLIDAIHAHGMKIIQDVVFNHTGNFGEEFLCPMFTKDESADLSDINACMQFHPNSLLPTDTYASMASGTQYATRLALMKNTDGVNHDTHNYWHHFGYGNWDNISSQWMQIAGDCVDLNTENPAVLNYLVEAYTEYIKMGVDSFRIDTGKHIPRLAFNKVLNNAFLKAGTDSGNPNFYMFSEICCRYSSIWYRDIPAISTPFYTWKESKEYAWDSSTTSFDTLSIFTTNNDESSLLTDTSFFSHINSLSAQQQGLDNGSSSINSQPTSTNAFLSGNSYHATDYTMNSGLNVIDFPMHWNFRHAENAFNVATGGDQYYNDASWNVVYVDSHDYAPDGDDSHRFSEDQPTWAENLSLMFTFRGIPCLYYGSEIEFKKGALIDKGTLISLEESGRAYYGDNIEGSVDVSDFGVYSNATGTMASTLSYPLAKHIQRLNLIRRSIPALQRGQYSTADITKSGVAAFKRRYTNSSEGVDSFVLVTISGDATFSNIPSGTYTDVITGSTYTSTGSLSVSCSGKGNARILVLNQAGTTVAKIGEDGTYLK